VQSIKRSKTMLTRRIFWTLLITGAIAISTTSAQAQSTDRRSWARPDFVNRPDEAPERVSGPEAGAATKKQVPFAGAIQGNDTDSTGPLPGTIVVTTSGTGIGTHLGQFSFTLENTLTFATLTVTGLAHFIANEGSIDATIVGSGEPTATPGVFSITEIYTITGGTGRFAGAQGIVTVERFASAVTFSTVGVFHGTITSPGAAH
jgi:hypothetical protein